jgi:hypothetical protein
VTDTDEPDVPRRWQSLDTRQRQLARELCLRADRIRAQAPDGMRWADAIDAAAQQLGYDDRTGT